MQSSSRPQKELEINRANLGGVVNPCLLPKDVLHLVESKPQFVTCVCYFVFSDAKGR